MITFKTLDQCEDQFVDYLHYQNEVCTDRNQTWFPPLIKEYKTKYTMWTILFVDNKIQGFSGIQEKGFPTYTCRIMTRTFIDPELRFHGIGRGLYRDTNPPMLQICKYHYNWVLNNLDKNNCFTSTEHNRKSVIKNNLKKMATDLNIETRLLNDRYQTYPIDEKNAWQNVGLYIIKDDKFDIPSMTQKKWIEKYGK